VCKPTISAARKWEVLLAIFPEEQPRLTRGEAWGRVSRPNADRCR